jgi:hypothetical protein
MRETAKEVQITARRAQFVSGTQQLDTRGAEYYSKCIATVLCSTTLNSVHIFVSHSEGRDTPATRHLTAMKRQKKLACKIVSSVPS